MRIPEVYRKNSPIIIAYLVFLTVGTTLVLLYNKRDICLYINGLNNPFFDFFFKYLTEFGAFLLIAPIILLQLFIRFRFALITAVSAVVGSIITQVLKRLVYYDSPRPIALFGEHGNLHLVDGVHLHTSHSFPSGHTTGAFALFVALALINRRPYMKIVFLIIAILVAYSRMYLSQHFLLDVVVGSAVGTFSAFVCFFWFNNRYYSKMRGLDKSLLRYRKNVIRSGSGVDGLV
jgi:membrane-associated phospholipid phosphatase